MKDTARRRWAVVAVAGIVSTVLWVLYAVWRSPHRIDLATYGAFAAAVAVMGMGWIAWVWRTGVRRAGPADKSEKLVYLADLLAEAVERQWTRAADERKLLTPEPITVRWGKPVLPLAGPGTAAIVSRRFDPIPGLSRAGKKQLTEGHIGDLHALYGGLGSGRLVVAGAAGSGKSGAAVLLILAALRHRGHIIKKDRPAIPVPVLFTLHGWDPAMQRIGDWLVAKMHQTYPMFAGKTGTASAAALVAAGKIALVLDGLDEMPENLRPIALQALSEQAAFRVVVLSRTAEMASAVSRRGVLAGAAAVELRPLAPNIVANYLSSVQPDPPPDGWHNLIDRIRRKEDPIAQSLNNPLTVTLIRDTCRGDDEVLELLKLCDDMQDKLSGTQLSEEITNHLLDRVLPAAYAHRPGEVKPSYNLQVAQRVLTNTAMRMAQDRTRDLQWWRFLKWAPAAPRIIVSGFVGGLLLGLVTGLATAAWADRASGIAVSIVVGISAFFFLIIQLASGSASGPPRLIGNLKNGLRRALSLENLGIGLGVGSLFGFSFGLVPWFAVGLPGRFADSLAFSVCLALLGGFMDTVEYPDTSALTPVDSLRNDRKFALVFGSIFGLMTGSLAASKGGPLAGLGTFLVIGILSGLTSTVSLWSSIAAMQLAMRWHSPVRLMKFLDDAHMRGILRVVGPVYQFRHASLQDRLVTKHGNVPLQRSGPTYARQADVLSTWIKFAADPATSSTYLAENFYDLTDLQTIALLRDECDSQPTDSLLWRHLGLLLLADRSADAYAAAEAGDPDPFQQSATLLDSGDLDHALGWAYLARAADLGPGALLMSQIQAHHGELDRAMEALETAAEHIDPERLREVFAVYDELLTAQPKQPWLHAGRAEALQRAGQLEDALTAYDRALRLAPDNPSLHFNRGALLFRMSRLEEAEAEFLSTIRLRPDDILGAAVLLAAIVWPADNDQARQHFQAALSSPGERLPPFTRAFYRAVALAGLGQYSKAIAEVKDAASHKTSQEIELDDSDKILFARFRDPPLHDLELIRQFIEKCQNDVQASDGSIKKPRKK